MKNMKKNLAIVAMVALVFGFIGPVSAASISSVKDTVSTMKASTVANHTITFTTPTGVAAGQDITLTFDASYNMGSVAFGDIDVADDGSDLTLAAVANAATWGAVVAGQVLTITSDTGTIAAGSVITVEIGTNATAGSAGVNQITNGAAGNDKTISIAGTFGDSGKLATAFLTDDVVTIDATVNPSLAFAISSNAMHFGVLTTANGRWADDTTGQALETSGHNLTVSTNANNGYTITYIGDTLKSGANSIAAATIAGDADGTPGTAQFALNYSISGGTGGAVAAGYEQASNNHKFVANTLSTLASGTGPTLTTTYGAYYLANISAVTPAGTYSTALTYTAVANF